MKLSELITHTSNALEIDRTVVESHARYLRENGYITSGGRGLVAAEMAAGDWSVLFVSVCGVSTARQAPVEIAKWKSKVPELFDYIERRVSSGPTETDFGWEFDVDNYCARKIGERTQTFGERDVYLSYLTRTVTPIGFWGWLKMVGRY